MSTPEELVALICPTLSTISGCSTYISLAEQMTSSGFFGANYSFAVALRASHLYMLNTKRNGQSGYVTSQQEGRLARSFGGMGNIKSELMTTSYGMQLLDLIKATNVGATVSSTEIYETYLGG